MLSFVPIYEQVVLRKDIAGGLGGNFGRYGGGMIGGVLGGLLGASTLPDDFDMEHADIENILPVAGGMYAGAGIGSVLGGQIGRGIGRASISDPDKPADFTKASHRVGYLAEPHTKWYGALSDLVFPGSASAVGAIRNAVSDEGSEKLGYGSGPKLVQALSVPLGLHDFAPLVGIASPERKVKNK